MSKRTINFDDGPNGTPPKQGATTMAELLNDSEALWRAGDKQRAFINLLGACAFMSAGVAQAMKTAEDLKARLDALEKK